MQRAKAADERSKSFKQVIQLVLKHIPLTLAHSLTHQLTHPLRLIGIQGGGGDKLKMKQKRLEEAEKKNKELGGENTLKWGGDVT